MTLTAKEMLPAVGQTVSVRFESLVITCRVEDVKCSYGRPRLLITPAAGTGSQWVETSRITGTTDSNQSKLTS